MNTNKYYFAPNQPTTVVGFIRALLEGKKIIWNEHCHTIIDPNNQQMFWINTDDQICCGIINGHKFSIQPELPQISSCEVEAKQWAVIEQYDWFDLVSEEKPLLCWVTCGNSRQKVVSITSHTNDEDGQFFIDTDGVLWDIATPLTEADILQFLANAKELI